MAQQLLRILISITLIIGLAPSVHAKNIHYEGLRIEGDDSFNKQVIKVLKYMKQNARSEYEYVMKYIGRIRPGIPTSINTRARPPVCTLSEKTAFGDPMLCASALVHEASHSYLHQKYKGKLKRNELFAKTAGREAELFCINNSIKLLQKLGAPKYYIDYLKKQDGRHADVNKDGWYDYEDWKLLKQGKRKN